MKPLTIFVLVLVTATFALGADGMPTLQPSIAKALEAASTFFVPVKADVAKQRQAAFHEALAEISKNCDEKTAITCRKLEGESIECKLVCIALDFKQHPERYEEISTVYLHAPLPAPPHVSVGLPKFPSLAVSHLNEAYRLTWEYMLLWPQEYDLNFRTLDQFHADVALSALEKISSEKSQIIYEYCFTKSAKLDIIGREFTTETSPWTPLLHAISLQQTPESVQRMLRCLDTLKANAKFYNRVRLYIVGLLIGLDNLWAELYEGTVPRQYPRNPASRERRERWALAIKQVPSATLSADLQAVLKQVLEFPQY